VQENNSKNRSFDDLVRDEFDLVKSRREKLNQPNPDSPALTGLALSGGGIRSATFSLGFLQALSRQKVFPKIDYLSTVSGGSYIGSFFGALFLSRKYRGYQFAENPEQPLQSERGKEAVRKLREAGRFLTPGGTSDAAFAAAVVVRNWIALHIVLGVAAILLFWATYLADGILAPDFAVGPSPTLTILVFLALIYTIGYAVSYWITGRDWVYPTLTGRLVHSGVFWGLVVAVAAGIAYLCGYAFPTGIGAWTSEAVGNSSKTSSGSNILNIFKGTKFVSVSVVLCASFAIFAYLKGEQNAGGLPKGAHKDNPSLLIESQDRIRGFLSRRLAYGLVAVSFLVLFTAMQWAGRVWEQYLQNGLFSSNNFFSVSNFSAFALAFGPPLLSYLASKGLKSGSSGDSSLRRWIGKISGHLFSFSALALLAAWLILWSVVAYALFAVSQQSTLFPNFVFWELSAMTLLLTLALILAYAAAARSFSFINLSSLATFYAARLKRAYIGASSREREHGSIAEDYDQDNISLAQYYKGGAAGSAPLHLINMTIAETVSDDANIVAHDRKGKPMHISPCGTVFEGNKIGQPATRAVSDSERAKYSKHFGEELPLANWIAISGAAVSAAIGSGTSLAISILATLGNVRLGYWWKEAKSRSRSFKDGGWLNGSVHSYLFMELIGKFFGTNGRRWYLTDGGHFDNTGLYPLLQREVKFIIACDNGADPNYHMSDVTKLLRLAA